MDFELLSSKTEKKYEAASAAVFDKKVTLGGSRGKKSLAVHHDERPVISQRRWGHMEKKRNASSSFSMVLNRATVLLVHPFFCRACEITLSLF